MPSRSRALILAVLFAALPAYAGEAASRFEWKTSNAWHGGFSGIEVSEDGRSALVLSDRAWLVSIELQRGAEGRLSGVAVRGATKLDNAPETKGRPDTEGLAIADDGRIFVSVESPALVYDYGRDGATPAPLPTYDMFRNLPDNRELEALAVAPDGALWTLPEGQVNGAFPMAIYRSGAWVAGPVIRSSGGFAPVGLDFGPDGRLYLLERQLFGPFGFRTRIRRMTLRGDLLTAIETVAETDLGTYDNLEGISVWRDESGGLIATTISDDNFFVFQRTEFVEFALPD